MKKFFSLILIVALVFTFASCSVIDKADKSEEPETAPATTLPVPVIDESTYSEEFKDENGRVVYTVDVIVPYLEEFDSTVLKAQINTFSYELFKEACEKAELNIENAASYMDSNGSSVPWSRRIDFEISHIDGHFVSFIIKEYFSSQDTEGEPVWSSATFSVTDGSPCYLSDFAPDTDKNKLTEAIVENLIYPELLSVYYAGATPDAEFRQLVGESFFPENFYLTADGMGFYISSYVLNPQNSGTYTFEFTREELGGILTFPE